MNQVRVFLSSTFADFARERELMHAEVAPTIDDMCRHFGLSFELTDLRWGVTARDVDQHRTTEICLAEVDLCRQVSPELNFMLLLGDRAGSRLLPDRASSQALERLVTELADIKPQDPTSTALAAQLRRLFSGDPSVRGGVVVRDDSPDGQEISRTVFGADAIAWLSTLTCNDPAAEELRRSLAFSLTHQEVLRSGTIAAQSRNDGAIAIIRTAGQPELQQRDMRAAVARAFGDRATELTADFAAPGASDPAYEKEFVRRSTALLGNRVQLARPRGLKSHHFAQIATEANGLTVDASSCHQAALAQIRRWATSDTGPRAAAIVGGAGSGKTTTLRYAKSMLEAIDARARAIHLEIGTTPDLQVLRNLAIALIQRASPLSLNEEAIEGLSSDLVPQLIGKAASELKRMESAAPLLVLLDDLDLVANASSHAALSWLWSEATDRKILFTCGEGLAQELRAANDVELIVLGDLTESELLAVAIRAGAARGASWLSAKPFADAARTDPTPGYVHSLVDAALAASPSESARWANGGQPAFCASFLRYLQDGAPFPQSVCNLFLALSAASEHGVAGREFLAISYEAEDIRASIVEQFPVAPAAGQTPPLVWHRLTNHFAPVVELTNRSGALASRVRAPYAEAVTAMVGAESLLTCRTQLANALLADVARAGDRAVLVLPSLLTGIGEGSNDVLAELALTQSFIAASVSHDHAEALGRAIGMSSSQEIILGDIMKGSRETDTRSPQDQSHWLLDLSVLMRGLGRHREAADLGRRAVEIRQSQLGGSHPLTVAAVIEATYCDLEAGEYAAAERLCQLILDEIPEDARRTPARLRVKNHLASALAYQQRFDEAEPMLRELLAAYTSAPDEQPELFSVYNGLCFCSTKRGAFQEAERYGLKSVSVADRLFGPRSKDAAVARVTFAGGLLESGRASEAAPVLERAVSIFDSLLDQNHPWMVNAAVGYFNALSRSSQSPEALDFLVARLTRLKHFSEAINWIQAGIPTILTIIEAKDNVRVRAVLSALHDLAAGSSGEGFDVAARAARNSGHATSFENDDVVRGFLMTGVVLSVLAVLAAASADVISPSAAKVHLRVLENQLATILGTPVSPLSMQQPMRMAWQQFASSYQRIDDCERLLNELRRPPPQDLRQRGEELIRLAARHAAANELDQAIETQAAAVAITAEAFGEDSPQHAIGTINLAALFFRASRHAEAFDRYRDGIIRALHGGFTVEKLAGAIENLATTGSKSEKFFESGEAFRSIAALASAPVAMVSVGLLSASAFLRARSFGDAVDAIDHAVAAHAQMTRQDAEAWRPAVLNVVEALKRQLPDTDQPRLASILLRFKPGEPAT